MPLPDHYVEAVYKDPGLERYRGNPLIEALPPIMDLQALKTKLTGKVKFNPKDCFEKGHIRAHQICALLDDFFQPLAMHKQLEEKISIMIRAGYVGRNLADGSLNKLMQESYERIMAGKSSTSRFVQSNSTAKSLSLIGCSGSGKSTTINRILATYPPVIYHSKYNFIQLPYENGMPFGWLIKEFVSEFLSRSRPTTANRLRREIRPQTPWYRSIAVTDGASSDSASDRCFGHR